MTCKSGQKDNNSRKNNKENRLYNEWQSSSSSVVSLVLLFFSVDSLFCLRFIGLTITDPLLVFSLEWCVINANNDEPPPLGSDDRREGRGWQGKVRVDPHQQYQLPPPSSSTWDEEKEDEGRWRKKRREWESLFAIVILLLPSCRYFHASAFYFMLCFLSSIFFLLCHVILVFCWFSFPPSTLLLIYKLFKGKKREENSWWEDITWDDDLLLFHVLPQRRSLTGTVWDNFHLLFLFQILIWCWSLLYINNQMSNQDLTTQRLINSTDNCKENWFQKPFRSGHDFDSSFCGSAEKGTLSI